MAALDLKKGSEEGFEFQLRHPISDEPLELWFSVCGRDSDKYQAAADEQDKRRRERMARDKRKLPTKDEILADVHDLLAAVTVGWRAGAEITLDGAPWPAFSRDAVRKLYTCGRFPWIVEQVDAAMRDRANFLPRSATS